MRFKPRYIAFNLTASFMVIAVLLLPVNPIQAYHHHDSMIRWREYGSAAFEEARRTGKPIFMLISAIWCYNCHIYMEKSLETKDISAYINENYIPVFVDYDRRKDVARSYPAGGIPVTVIIAPTGENLISVPGYIEKEVLLGNLKKTVTYVKEEFKPETKETKASKRDRGITLPDASGLSAYLNGFEKMVKATYDPVYGGFGQSAKMVYAEKWRRLLEVYEKGKEKELLDMSRNTLDHMIGAKQKKVERRRPSFKELVSLREREKTALEEVDRLQKGDRIVGVYDTVEGGFFRYATRRDWAIPHYEKMLMENAEMTALFVEGHRITKDKRYREAAVKSIDYILNTLYDGREGAFYGSQDADEVYYHFSADERKKVKAPRVDRTSYTASGARTAIMMLDVSEEMRDERYRKAGLKGLSFLEANLLSEEGALSYYDPEKKKGFINGQLEDNAWLALAFLKGYNVSKEKRYLEKAESVIRFTVERLYDRGNGGFFERRSTSREFYREEELFLDSRPDSANGVMAYALIRAYQATNNNDYLRKAEETVGYFMAEFSSGGLTDIDPYMHRAAQMLLDSGRYK